MNLDNLKNEIMNAINFMPGYIFNCAYVINHKFNKISTDTCNKNSKFIHINTNKIINKNNKKNSKKNSRKKLFYSKFLFNKSQTSLKIYSKPINR